MDSPDTLIAPPLAGPLRRRSPALAAAMLVLCCVLWGYSFPAMQIATRAFDRHVLDPASAADPSLVGLASRAFFNALRYGAAAILYGLLTLPRQRGRTRHDTVGGLAIGAVFAAGMFLQVGGLRWTLPSVSGFLTALAVVFAPLAQALLLRRPVGRTTWSAVALALGGMALLSLPNPGAAAPRTLAARPPIPLLGELMTVASAVVFTVQILGVDHFGRRADPARLTFLMLATTALASLAVAALLPGWRFDATAARALAADPAFLWSTAGLVVFSSVLAIHVMNTWQPAVLPATASVIYCTEPLFATLFSVAFGTERLTAPTLAGGAVVLAAVLVVARRPATPAERPSQAGAERSAA